SYFLGVVRSPHDGELAIELVAAIPLVAGALALLEIHYRKPWAPAIGSFMALVCTAFLLLGPFEIGWGARLAALVAAFAFSFRRWHWPAPTPPAAEATPERSRPSDGSLRGEAS